MPAILLVSAPAVGHPGNRCIKHDIPPVGSRSAIVDRARAHGTGLLGEHRPSVQPNGELQPIPEDAEECEVHRDIFGHVVHLRHRGGHRLHALLAPSATNQSARRILQLDFPRPRFRQTCLSKGAR